MRRWGRTALVCLLAALPAVAGAKPLERAGAVRPAEKVIAIGLRDVIDTVEKTYAQMTGLRADFFQRSTLAANEREYRATGEMYLRPPGREPAMFRFDYFRPTTQQIVCNGTKMWVFLPENRQVILSEVGFVFNPSGSPFDTGRGAGNFIQGLGSFSRDFLVTFAEEMYDVEGNYVLVLQPRRPMAFIEKIFMVVDRHAVVEFVESRRGNPLTGRPEPLFPVLSTTVFDHQRNTTTMEFSNIRTNERLPSGIFDFMVPAGVDVVRPPTAPRG